MNYGCNGRRAVISGGTSGIGLAAARTLLVDGAEVWLLARTERPQLLAELKENYGEKVHFIQCDVANVDCCKAAAAQIKNAGSVDFLVNSAGIYREQSMEMLTETEFDEIFGVNVKGTVFLTQALLPYMAAGGAVVNVASDAGVSGNYGCAAYCASKGRWWRLPAPWRWIQRRACGLTAYALPILILRFCSVSLKRQAAAIHWRMLRKPTQWGALGVRKKWRT